MPNEFVDEDDESIDVNLRSSKELAKRLAILAAVLTRIGLESNATVGGDEEDVVDADGERFDLLAWLAHEHAVSAMSPNESVLLDTPVGQLAFDRVAEWSWQAERFAALAWAGALLETLEPFDKQADVSALLARVPSPWSSIKAFADELELRGEEEIANEIERCEVWLWRAETEEARRRAPRSELPEIAIAIAEVVAEGEALGLLQRAPDGDFLAADRPFHHLNDDQRAAIAIIASERLRALNWLIGASDDWDNLPAEI